MSCQCNTSTLADKAEREQIKNFYAENSNIGTMDKVLGNPIALGAGLLAGGILTFAGMKLAKGRR